MLKKQEKIGTGHPEYMSKSYTTSKNAIDRQYTGRGQLQCQPGVSAITVLLSLFQFYPDSWQSQCVFRLPVTGSREIRNLVFFLGFFEDSRTPGVYCSRQQTPEALFRHLLLLFLGLEHDILFPIGAASEPLSTMGSMSLVNSRYGPILTEDTVADTVLFCYSLEFFGLILLNSGSADLFTRKQDLHLCCQKSGRY